MIKKSILLSSILLSLGANAIETIPTQTYTVTSSFQNFTPLEYNTEKEANGFIHKYYRDNYQGLYLGSSDIFVARDSLSENHNKIYKVNDGFLKDLVVKEIHWSCPRERGAWLTEGRFHDGVNYVYVSGATQLVLEQEGLYYKTHTSYPDIRFYLDGSASQETGCVVDITKPSQMDLVNNAIAFNGSSINFPNETFTLSVEKDEGTQSCAVGNPCDVATGNKFQTEVDFVGDKLYFARYYNSENSDLYSSTGYIGWTHNYSNRIYDQDLTTDLSEIVIYDETGHKKYYTKHSTDLYIGKSEINTTVNIVLAENEVYEKRAGKTYVYFLDTGLLKRIIYPDYVAFLEYSTYENQTHLVKDVKTNTGDSLSFSYHSSGGKYFINQVNSYNKTIYYAKKYLSSSSEFNLWKVSFADRNVQEYQATDVKEYHYEDTNFESLLTGITDGNGVRYASWTYDDKGWAISSEHAGGFERIDIALDRSSVTNSKGAVTQYVFDKVAGKNILRNIISPDAVSVDGGDYDPSNPYAKTSISNPNGTTTQNEYNDLNQIVRTYTIDGLGAILSDNTFEYVERQELGGGFNISSLTTPTLKTEFHYEDRAARAYSPYSSMGYDWKIPLRDYYDKKINKIVYTDLTNHTTPYATNGRTKEIKFTYHDRGQDLRAIDGFRTDIQDIIYYKLYQKGIVNYIMSAECIYDNADFSTGRVNESTSLAGCKYVKLDNFTYDYNSPQQITDYNGVVTNITYDSDNRVESSTLVTPEGNVTTSYVYDNEDQLERVNLPNGSWLKYFYNDARYLTKIKNSLGEIIKFTTDLEGMVTKRIIKSSTGAIVQQQNWVYSTSNRLMKTLSGNLFKEFYGYDSLGRVDNVTDHLGNISKVNFDGLNRVSKEIDQLNGEIVKTYDASSRVNTVTDQRGNTTTFTVDGFGNNIRMVSPDTGTTDMWYNEANNMTKKLLANGTEINYTFDKSNRLKTIVYPNTSYNVSIDYDTANYGKDKIAKITYKHGTIEYDYTALGMVDTQTNIINGVTYLTNYDYTAWGALTSMTYPSGSKVNYALDNVDRVTGVTLENNGTTTTLLSNVEYLAFGGIKSYDYGNGISFVADFDKDYLVRNVTHTDGGNDLFNETYNYAKMYQIDSITDGVDSTKSQSFVYDTKSQLNKANGSYGQYDYELDSVGNRLSKTKDLINVESYNVDTVSNKLLSVDKNLETRTLTYDDNGNVVGDNGYDSISKALTYGDNNRLIDVDGSVYGYNSLGQRVLDNGKINNYDLSGKLISVNDGNKVIEYIYLGNAKIAMVNDDSIDTNVYFAHNNYMNMPRLFTDEYKNVVWSGDFTPFGELYNEYGSISNVIRFTGQYKNIESEYFYNYFRDYDAGLGRYLQSDPIGLNGGINTYVYVTGNPINYVDPLGLYYLGISSKPHYTSGEVWNSGQSDHAWLDIYNEKGKIIGTMGNHPGDGNMFWSDGESDLKLNAEFGGKDPRYNPYIYGGYNSYIVDISKKDYLKLFETFVTDQVEWSPLNNCATWASETFNDLTGENFGWTGDKLIGITTPRSLSLEIELTGKGYLIDEKNYYETRKNK
jgi:RHS repeat-associated protein